MLTQQASIGVAPQYQLIMRERGIDADMIFVHPLIKPWRTLPERENCTLDATLTAGPPIRGNIKGYAGSHAFTLPVRSEVSGFRILKMNQIPPAELIGYGQTR